ncbi:hypothetical protein SDC9_174518 [bioreactor metagenome]|uniref:Uncharacterized protein n=1 Tax=bioreactor metagenome TaxID=1076179 RepID=A0A645GJE4_9ZZZZ
MTQQPNDLPVIDNVMTADFHSGSPEIQAVVQRPCRRGWIVRFMNYDCRGTVAKSMIRHNQPLSELQ